MHANDDVQRERRQHDDQPELLRSRGHLSFVSFAFFVASQLRVLRG
jgi:hypothetical protein